MELNEVQELCRKIAEEKEPEKAIQMLAEFRERLHLGVQETREIVRAVAKRLL